MDQDVKRRWVEALRSGKYSQGKAYLKTVTDAGARYCCLGVLVEGVLEREGEPDRINPQIKQFDGKTDYLPHEVAVPIGLTEDTQETLSRMNDRGLPFNQIADWIEENL